MNKSFLLSIFITVTFLSCNQKNNRINRNDKNGEDSIKVWISKSKNSNLEIKKRREYLRKSIELIEENNIDSSSTKSLSSIAYQYLKLEDTTTFFKINNKTLKLSEKIKDNFSLGDAHWNLATLFNNKEDYSKAYYHFNLASSYFLKSGNINEAAITEYGKAFIRGRFGDYTGSEVLLFNAIKKFKKTDNHKYLYNSYNYLAILQNDINDPQKALEYYNKALYYLKKIDNSSYLNTLYNNIGITYIQNKNYKLAIENFNKILEDEDFKNKDIDHYSRVKSNRAYARLLLKDTVDVLKDLKESLRIRDSLKNKIGILSSKIHIAKYYNQLKVYDSAKIYAKEANLLSKKLKNGNNYLETLELLKDVDSINSQKYFNLYVSFSDSIQIVERTNQNKFTRIEFETDEYIAENEILNKQRIWIITGSLLIFLILILVLLLIKQRAKNEKLFLENEKQKINQEIYQITLDQHKKLESEKIKERIRISEELHDGILGKLFGTRVGFGFLNISFADKDKKKYHFLLNELQTIEKDIRDVSHKLSDNYNISEMNFNSIIKQLISDKSIIGKFKYEVFFDDNINFEKIEPYKKINIYRIIQEGLQNIIKHAKCSQVKISLILENNYLELSITDNGVGFDSNKKLGGIGLKNIKSRIKKINGIFKINSSLNSGTKIEVKIPSEN